MKRYSIAEMFYSVQGEGARSGTANVFVRFSGCNLTCSKATEGFDCDTDFSNGIKMTAEEIVARALELCNNTPSAVILTGGEPTLQIDDELLMALKAKGFFLALETNGLRQAPALIDWISCSPKTAEHTLALSKASELRYVRASHQALPKPTVPAEHYFLSPAFSDNDKEFKENVAWCIRLCKENPQWKLSVQQHKLWNVR